MSPWQETTYLISHRSLGKGPELSIFADKTINSYLQCVIFGLQDHQYNSPIKKSQITEISENLASLNCHE